MIDMKSEDILKRLEEIAEKIHIHVHYEDMKAFEFRVRDGSCTLKGEYHVYIDRKRPLKEKIEILARELSKHNLDQIYIHPYIREKVLNRPKVGVITDD